MSQVEKQDQFAGMVSLLVQYARMLGYQVTYGDAFRDPRAFQGGRPYGHPDSFHKRRLAVDLNLFKDGAYLTGYKDHEPLGLFWESLGGTWGGRFSNVDPHHYSLGEETYSV